MHIIGLTLRRPAHPSGGEDANRVFVNADHIVCVMDDEQWSNGTMVKLVSGHTLQVLEDKFLVIGRADRYEDERLNRLLPE